MANEIGRFKGEWDELVELLDLAFAAPWTEAQYEAERRIWEPDRSIVATDDGQRHELIDGEHCVTPSPNTRHQRLSGNLYWLLRTYLENHPCGELFYAPFDVVFSHFDVVEPDKEALPE